MLSFLAECITFCPHDDANDLFLFHLHTLILEYSYVKSCERPSVILTFTCCGEGLTSPMPQDWWIVLDEMAKQALCTKNEISGLSLTNEF